MSPRPPPPPTPERPGRPDGPGGADRGRAGTDGTDCGSWPRRHRFLLAALAVGVLVRLLTLVAFRPAFVFSDGPTYLGLSEALEPSPDRVVGYAVLLRAVSWAGDGLWLVTGLQHLLGLVSAGVLYALLRRRGCGDGLATLAVLPLLLDGMQLVLEHAVLSDVLFQLLLVAAVAVLAWRPRPGPAAVAAAGLLLGLATLVRVVGQPTVLAAVVLVLLAVAGWRARLVRVGVLVGCFVAPLVGYAAWSAAAGGPFALTEAGGRSLYMRTTTFVDCDRLTLPDHERQFCPREPVGERQDPTWYGWHGPGSRQVGVTAADLPAGVTPEEAMGDFGARALRAQPGDYALIVLRDAALTFAPARVNHFEYDTAWKWKFSGFYGYETTDWTGPTYLEREGTLPEWNGPLALALVWYGRVVYLWGPLSAALLLLAAAGLVRRPRDEDEEDRRPVVLLLLGLAVGLTLVPEMTVQFTWRYTLPVLTFGPAAAALAWRHLRGPRVDARRADDARAAEVRPGRPARRLVAPDA